MAENIPQGQAVPPVQQTSPVIEQQQQPSPALQQRPQQSPALQKPAAAQPLPQLRAPPQTPVPAQSPAQTPAQPPAPAQRASSQTPAPPPQRLPSQTPVSQQPRAPSRTPSLPPQQQFQQQQPPRPSPTPSPHLQQQTSPHLQQPPQFTPQQRPPYQQPHPHPPPPQFQNGHMRHQQPQHLHQPQPQRIVGRPPDPVMAHRAPIVNPPSQAIPQPPPPRREPPIVDPRGGIEHPSPGRNYHQENPKVWDDYMRLTFAIEQCLSDSVRCAVRQNWEKCLLGTSFHQGFLLNAMLDKVSPDIARGSMRDFGAKIVKNTKAEIIAHMSSADIDEVTNAILSIASDRFLDAALEMRLRTIDAKPLINALARAERLGYEPGDIIEEPMGGQERVIPQDVPVSQQPLPPPPPALAQPATKQCNICSRLFEDEPPYVYHVANKVCMLRPESKDGFPFSCGNCGQGFENTYGLQYHNSTNACKKYVSPKPAVAAKATLSTAPAPAPTSAQATRAYVPYKAPSQLPPAPLPPARSPHVLPATRPTATPTRPEASQPLPPSSSQPERSQTPTIDPYAHLSEEKLASLNNELLRCEQIFTDRFREAEDIADPVERRTKLDNLKNSFGTRQSIIRKKYGVRLRERRTKAELQAERVRMGLDGKMSSAYSSPTGGRSGHYATTPTSSQPIDGTAYAVKRVRTENGTPSGRRSESESRESPDSTHRRRKTPTPGKAPPMAETLRAQRLPQSADDDDDNMSDSSSDNDDIPARLPDSVRQSLSASQR